MCIVTGSSKLIMYKWPYGHCPSINGIINRLLKIRFIAIVYAITNYMIQPFMAATMPRCGRQFKRYKDTIIQLKPERVNVSFHVFLHKFKHVEKERNASRPCWEVFVIIQTIYFVFIHEIIRYLFVMKIWWKRFCILREISFT